MSGLRERLAEIIRTGVVMGFQDEVTNGDELADAAILALRQWMDAEGLKIVPDDVSNWHVRFTQFASGEVQSALDSAPDALGDGP